LILTEKLGIKFIPNWAWSDPDPKLFIPDPDPSKSSGSDRIRIHNTGPKDFLSLEEVFFEKVPYPVK
jgi:hypothetical protein